MKFLILSFILIGCASTPKPAKVDLSWEFLQNSKGETKACLSKADVLKLNEMRVLKCSER